MNDPYTENYELPKKLEKIFATLSTYFAKQGKPLHQKLLVNSSYYVQEGWTTGYEGESGHLVYFEVPALFFNDIIDEIGTLAKEICSQINRLSNVKHEFIDEVLIDVKDDSALQRWRENSRALIQDVPESIDAEVSTIWLMGYFRLFLSHKSEHKKFAKDLKESLDYYGVSCFVAHEDIEPTTEWQNEIEKALFSMDALVAIMTEGFSDSEWTDQEIGVAIGRRVHMIHINLGMNPYGFIGKYQALQGRNKNVGIMAKEIYDLLWKKEDLQDKLSESLVNRFLSPYNFAHANHLMDFLERIKKAPPDIIEKLESAPDNNSQLAGAFQVEVRLPLLIEKLKGNK